VGTEVPPLAIQNESVPPDPLEASVPYATEVLGGFPGRGRAARLGTLVAEADALAGRLGILVTGASGGIFVLAPLGRGVLFLGLRGRLVAHKPRGYRSSLTSASG
jgi:hypothetical protein